MNLKDYIRDIPDFPQPGILFRDITPLLRDAAAFRYASELLAEHCGDYRPAAIAAIESRGFIFGAPLAQRLDLPLVLVRKPGKLPAASLAADYALEYGVNTLEMQGGDIAAGQRVLLVDDLLATGGTLAAAARLIELAGGQVAAIGAVIELEFLAGRKALEGYEIFSLIQY